MSVSKEEFRRALGHFAAGVTVVTTRHEGNPAGITVTAFSSLSLEPPLILVCIDKRARLHDTLAIGHHFAVNMLSEDQEALSRRFATSGDHQFEGVGYTDGVSGAPILNDTLTVIECRVVDHADGGDHTIVIGEVESTMVREGKPLLYFRGGYNRLA